MKKTVLTLALLAAATPAFAQITTFAELDVDQNGELSFEELTVLVPELTVEQFAEADADANGALSEDEYTIFVEAMAG